MLAADEGDRGIRGRGSITIGGTGWLTTELSVDRRTGNIRNGFGVGEPQSPFGSVRLYAFNEYRNDNFTMYNAVGGHIRRDVYEAAAAAAIAVYFAGKVIAGALGTSISIAAMSMKVPEIKEIIGRVAGFIPIFMGSFMDDVQSIGAPSVECDGEVADYYAE